MLDYSLWEVVREVWLIVVCSILTVAVGLERGAVLWRFLDRARSLTDTVNRCLIRGAVAEGRTACERSRSQLADVLLVGFERAGRQPKGAVIAAVDRERQRTMLDLRARLWMLATIGATAPFLGLYGTVVGIMNAFEAISQKGEAGFSVVSKGISEALIHTAAGLFVALVAVVIYNFFNQHIGRIGIEVKLLTEEFLETLTEGVSSEPAPAQGTSEGTAAKAA